VLIETFFIALLDVSATYKVPLYKSTAMAEGVLNRDVAAEPKTFPGEFPIPERVETLLLQM